MTFTLRCFIAAGLAVPMLAQDPKELADLARRQREVARQAKLAGQVAIAGAQYEMGTRLLDQRKFEEAIQNFNAVIAAKSERADGALYWKAYALNRLGRRNEAVAAIAELRRDHPASRWLNDAQALEVEVRQSAGRPVSPDAESNDDIKLLAINGLMSADPDRAIPLLEGVLKGNASPRVKDRALFVLTQNRSARAQQLLADCAKGSGNPDLQLHAVRYLGMSGTPEAQQQLSSIYAASNDGAVKREIIRSFMVARAQDTLLNLAKSEKDQGLRWEAIRQLGVLRAVDPLMQLYSAETVTANKTEIIRGLMIARASDKLRGILSTEKTPELRAEAMRDFALTPSVSPDMLAALYSGSQDEQSKREIVNALFARGDAKSLIAIARKETDNNLKASIVSRLATMRNNKDATDYMMELLK